MYRVLVLLATHNGEAHIRSQLSSLLSQRGVNVTIDVRDDNSSDTTRSIVSELSETGDMIALRPDHRGTGSASGNFFELLLGADAAGFDFVALCDQDDVWKPDKLVRAASQLRAEGGDAYSSSVEALWPDGRRKHMKQNPKLRFADHLFEGAGQGCTFVLTVDFFVAVQMALRQHCAVLKNIHYHDWTIYALARILGRRWIFDQEITMIYRQHDGNDTGARSSAGGVLRRLVLIRSGWYCSQVNAIVELILAVRPSDPVASKWRALTYTHSDKWRHRMSRLCFVAWNGRRRAIDRVMLVGAVLCGYL